jgi:hypothetical protein
MKNETDRATPRPWIAHGIIVRRVETGLTIAVMNNDSEMLSLKPSEQDRMRMANARANAALIVRAVNAHDRLVEACEAIASDLNMARGPWDDFNHVNGVLSAIRETHLPTIRAALALTRE